MKAYLPSKFLQVALHANGGKPARLDDLRDLLAELGFTPVIDVELSTISDSGLLVLVTRQCRYPFEPQELEFIEDYVGKGNPIFHLSNHPPLTKEDSRLGKLLGYQFHSCVQGADSKREFDVYPVSGYSSLFASIDPDRHFTIRNSCIVSPLQDTFTVIADFSRSDLSGVDPKSAFGIAQPRTKENGAIVALADSGLLGEPTPENPGPGLSAGNNRDLVGQILEWLRKQ